MRSWMVVCSLKKDEFLSSKVNKQRFVYMLTFELELHGCTVQHATADADVLIVQTILGEATKMTRVFW